MNLIYPRPKVFSNPDKEAKSSSTTQRGNLFPVGLRSYAEIALEEARKVERITKAEVFRGFADRNRRIAQFSGDGRRPEPVEERLGRFSSFRGKMLDERLFPHLHERKNGEQRGYV